MSQKTQVSLSVSIVSARVRIWTFRVLVLMLFGFPGSGRLTFDGLPFDSKIEFIFLVGIVTFGVAPKAVGHLKSWLFSLDSQQLLIVFGGLVFLVVIKLLTFVDSPLPSGFEVCYSSVYVPLPENECERSYDLPFVTTGEDLTAISSVERYIDFGAIDDGNNTANSNWRLPFLNDWGRFDPLWVTRLPFSADFAGTIDIETDSWIPIIFLGELNVRVDDQIISAKDYDGSANVLPVAVSKGRHKLVINYRFSDDGQITVPDIQPVYIGEYASLRVLEPVNDLNKVELQEMLKPIAVAETTSLTSKLFFNVLNLSYFLIFALLIFNLIKKYLIYCFFCFLIFGWVFFISKLSQPIEAAGLSRSSLAIGMILGLGLWAILKKFPRYAWFYGGSIGLVQVGLQFTSSKWWNVPQFRQRDSDWFVHQGLARRIFTQMSLEGGESIFYFQPAMRYLIFIGHLVLGNNDVLLSILLVTLFFSMLSIAMLRVLPQSRGSFFLPVLSTASLVILFSEFTMASYVRNLTTELPTWISLLVFLYLVSAKIFSTWQVVSLGILAGLAMNFRPNQAPGWIYLMILATFGIFYCESISELRKKLFWILATVTLLFGSLSLIHNLYYGRSFVAFSSSGVLSQQYSWKILFKLFYDSESRDVVIDKLRFLTMFTTHPLARDKYWSYTNSFQMMHLCWILSLISALRTTKNYLLTGIYAVVPFAFLIPMVMFDASSYFPRHLVIVNMSFLFSATFMLFNTQKVEVLKPATQALIKQLPV